MSLRKVEIKVDLSRMGTINVVNLCRSDSLAVNGRFFVVSLFNSSICPMFLPLLIFLTLFQSLNGFEEAVYFFLLLLPILCALSPLDEKSHLDLVHLKRDGKIS